MAVKQCSDAAAVVKLWLKVNQKPDKGQVLWNIYPVANKLLD